MTTIKKDATSKKTTKTDKTKKDTAQVKKETIEEKTLASVIEEVSIPSKKVIEVKKTDPNESIRVVSLVTGRLTYESKRSLGYQVEWDGYLSENYMEFSELVNMRNSQRAFFEKMWILLDEDILDELRVRHHYKDLIDLKDIPTFLSKPQSELGACLDSLNDGARRLIVDYAYQAIINGSLDSTSTIKLLEQKLDVDLTSR